ncbi:MAG TPA: dTDP-4-dehydrorhamnose reductase [Eoetvoesiella sp.]
MKILLTGKNGQVGFELQRALAPVGELVALGRAQADLEKLAELQATLEAQQPDIIVNAAAYTNVDKAENDKNTANKVNAQAVKALADYSRAHNTLLVHYSTDYVFDGEKPGPYLESDPTHPLSVYGHTKLAGEEAILQSGCKAFIFRTSWVFSARGSNFIKTIIRLAQERDSLSIVSDQIGAPTSAGLVADITARAIAGYPGQALPFGLYHLTATGETSWHGLARHVLDRLQRNNCDLQIKGADVHAIQSKDYFVAAKRPKNSLLDTSKLRKALALTLPHWSVDVDRVMDQISKHWHVVD